AEFIDLLVSPLPSSWVLGNIGTNSAEQLYVALSDGTNTAVVEHNDVNAATLTSWQEWNIEMTKFSGINLDNIQKVYIGLGDRNTPVQGGSGAIYVDDLRACPPRCVPAFAQMSADIAQPYDCLVNEADIMVLANDYLMRDTLIATSAPGSPISQYLFDGNFFDNVGSNHGTAIGNASIITDADRGQVVSLDGVGDYVDLGNPTDPCELDFGTGNWTVCAWVKTTMTGTGGDVDKGVIYGKGGDNAGGHRYGLYVNENQNPAGHVNLIIDDNAGDGIGSSYNKVQFTGDVLVSDGEWHHVIGLRDVNDLRLYIDGLPDGSTTIPADYDLVGVHQYNAYIGTITNNTDSTPYKDLQGSVDDVRIYGYALSYAEVVYLATDGAAGLHIPIISDADLYKGEPQGNQWINLRDYSVIADQYLDELLWP
ncbi:MAG: LamG domain-containing protein, partial [Planctomycetes bacterium]|nr:LamG domain-containing protein [Planctomycetota bacterium]